MKIDKYIVYLGIFVVISIFAWNYINTCSINENRMTIQQYSEKIDSLEVRVQKLEYFVENQPKQIVVNVNTKNQK